MDSESKKLQRILEALWPIRFPGAGEDVDEWKDEVLNTILEELKEIYASEEEKVAAGKEWDETKKE
jgi:hypothetical protein